MIGLVYISFHIDYLRQQLRDLLHVQDLKQLSCHIKSFFFEIGLVDFLEDVVAIVFEGIEVGLNVIVIKLSFCSVVKTGISSVKSITNRVVNGEYEN